MILVDTSVWIDHLHRSEPGLVAALGDDEVGTHPMVIEELALGSLKDRSIVLTLIGELARFPRLAHEEMLTLIEQRRLWSRGLSAVDVHLLGAAALVPGSHLWTRDKRLQLAARDVGVELVEEK